MFDFGQTMLWASAGGYVSGWAWDPSNIGTGLVLSNSDLTVTAADATKWGTVLGTRAIVGKKVFRARLVQNPGAGVPYFGVCVRGITLTNASFTADASGFGYGASGNKANNSSSSAFASSYTTGDDVDVAIDNDAGKIWFGKNGVWQNFGDPAAGTNPVYTYTGVTLYPAAYLDGNSAGCIWTQQTAPTVAGFDAL